MYSALAQLISSFFLVLGPVGVPVNVLVGEGALDITQTAREGVFLDSCGCFEWFALTSVRN